MGAALPDGQLDQLGVEQSEDDGGVEGGGGDEHLDDGGLASARLAAGQQVALGQGDDDLVAVLVLPDRNRSPQRTLTGIDQRPGEGLGVGQRVTTQHDHPGIAGVGWVAGDADLAGGQEGSQPLRSILQIPHLGAGR